MIAFGFGSTRVSVLMAVLVLVSGCGNGDGHGLSVTGGEPVQYVNADGQSVTARFYSLSDGSLNFVKLNLPEGVECTLPQSVSGSGARYTDDGMLTFWIRGDSATVETRDDQGQWQVLYAHLQAEGTE
ncbi:MAG: hypothetical protein AVO35_09865 [Candidatus Aegiribacteria sp. MLS_C]|nr:MAG: hypothetical protein AVO35_09865 [Candidatus Aegiribacteria sp. MLS_C]